MVKNRHSLERAFSPLKRRRTIQNRNEVHKETSTVNAASKMKVFVRVRPFHGEEESNQNKTIKVIDDKVLIFDPKEEMKGFFFHGVKQKGRDIAKKTNKNMQFMFDSVFNEESTNVEVYQGSTQAIINTLLEGYNCSVFVYGATGAGKTHTMLGNKENPGITMLTMTELYDQINQLQETKEIKVGVTYLEVYNENVIDLLNPNGPMHLREDGKGGVSVAGLKVQKIHSSEQLFNLLQKGNSNRTQHPTDANAESSRSHAVFQVYVEMHSKENGEFKYAKLSMIDLAGSERSSATGGLGARFKEGSNINKSLLALGNCINNLADGLRHIPYRDSKLTRLLKDSLGGNCVTIMIANVSPSPLSYEDTYNTLKYATRAASIKSKLTKNIMSVRVEHYLQINAELQKQNAALKTKVDALELAIKHPPVSPPKADPKYVEKLKKLFWEREQIYTEWWTLESQLRLLQWRIRCKTVQANHMRFQMTQTGADYNQEFIRNETSLSQLEARANGIIAKMTELFHKKSEHSEEYSKFCDEIEEAKVAKLLQTEANLLDLQCMLAGKTIENKHVTNIVKIQDKRLDGLQSSVDNFAKLCSDSYMLLRGKDLLTSTMEKAFKEELLLKGMKNVSWMDMEEGSFSEDTISLSSVSVRPFLKLSLSDIHSTSVPSYVPELRVKPEPLCTSSGVWSAGPSVKPDLNGTFTKEAGDEEDEFEDVTVPPRLSFHARPGSVVKSFGSKGFNKTPAPKKFYGANKENKTTLKVNSKFLTPVTPKTALAPSNKVNFQQKKTPEAKVSLSGLKMVRDKYRTPIKNQHPYIKQVKLKRLG